MPRTWANAIQQHNHLPSVGGAKEGAASFALLSSPMLMPTWSPKASSVPDPENDPDQHDDMTVIIRPGHRKTRS